MVANSLYSSSCTTCETQTISFHGIRPDDINGRRPISNPERGFRLEHIMKVSNLLNPYHRINYSHNFSSYIGKDENNFSEKTRLTQLYFYLTDYMKTSIPDNAFRNMQVIFDEIKRSGYKVILVFAYRYDDNSKYETYGDIKRHLAQLKSFLQKNESLIFAFQAGFLGLWGEWHHTGLDNSPLYKKIVLRDILKAIPVNKKLQVRETIYKTNTAGFIRQIPGNSLLYYPLTNEEYNRIGFQNAYFVLDQGVNAHWDFRWPDKDYFMVEREAMSSVVDGEMPYNGNWYGTFNKIAHGNQGGWQAIKRMKTHAYSSFSIIHNYNINIAAWKKQNITLSQFRNNKMSVTEDYFLDKNSREVTRTAYEYIRDHLGYRLQLKEATIPKLIHRGERGEFWIGLNNFGFAPVINKRPVYLVLIDENGHVLEFPVAVDPRHWLPVEASPAGEYSIRQSIHFKNTFAPGPYKVGIWMPDDSENLKYDSDYAIRLANGNIEWWKDVENKYLINIIGELQLF